jgi:hypothetical protein
LSLIHPDRRRLPNHARHLARQMLKPRTATRASVLQKHTMQLDSAVSLREDPNRLHPDHDKFPPGIRVVVGPETRSLLRQLLESRDRRVQQQLVREIVHQIQKRIIAAAKRIRRMDKARELTGRAARSAQRTACKVPGWLRSRASKARSRFGGRTVRTVGNRKPSARTRTQASPRIRAAVGDGRTARKPAERTTRPRTTRTPGE